MAKTLASRGGKRRFAEGKSVTTMGSARKATGKDLVRRGSSDVARSGRPRIDVDLRRTRIGQEKLIGSGSGEDISRSKISGSGGGKDITRTSKEVKTQPSNRSLARRGSSDVARPGRPSVDVDLRRTRIGQEKVIGSGSGEDIDRTKISRQTRATPEKPAGSGASRLGRAASRTLGGLGLMAYSSDVGAGSDKPQYYPGEGLKAKEKAKERDTSSNDYSSQLKKYRDSASASAASSPKASTASSSASTPSAKSVASTPRKATEKPSARASASTSTKPVRRQVSSKRASATEDKFMSELKASASRMKSAASDMAEKTSKMKEKATAFSRSFKKGGSVKSCCDGRAQRGHTKGKIR